MNSSDERSKEGRQSHDTNVSYYMVCASVREDNPRVLKWSRIERVLKITYMFYLCCSNIVRSGTSKSTKIILVVIISSDNIYIA